MKYRFQIASDVIRDGLGLELVDHICKVAAEVFRCDADHSLTVSMCIDELPFSLIEQLVLTAHTELSAFEEGTRT